MRNQPKDLTFTNGLAVPVKPEPSPTLVAAVSSCRGGMGRSIRFGRYQEPKPRPASRIRCRQTLTNLVIPIVRLIVIRLIGPCLLESKT
jgi:hypothetical protein